MFQIPSNASALGHNAVALEHCCNIFTWLFCLFNGGALWPSMALIYQPLLLLKPSPSSIKLFPRFFTCANRKIPSMLILFFGPLILWICTLDPPNSWTLHFSPLFLKLYNLVPGQKWLISTSLPNILKYLQKFLKNIK